MWSSRAFLFGAEGEWRCAAAGIFLPPPPPLPTSLRSARLQINGILLNWGACCVERRCCSLVVHPPIFSTGYPSCASVVCWYTSMKSHTSPVALHAIFCIWPLFCANYSTACCHKYDAGRKQCLVVS